MPVGITVEGANILTRSLIIFGQGAIRAHPFLLEEMTALQDTDHERALDDFDKVFWGHVGHSLTNAAPRLGTAGRGGMSRRRRMRERRRSITGSSRAIRQRFAFAAESRC